MIKMVTEHVPVYPLKHRWQCSCGAVNGKESHMCRECGTEYNLHGYINPCDSCGLCKNKVGGIQKKSGFDFLVRDLVRY